MPAGRPTVYKPEYCDVVIKLMKEGAAKVEVAYELDIDRSTLDDWIAKYPEFSLAFNAAKDASEGWWTKQGRSNLENKDFNSRLWEINMMNRFGWMKKAHSQTDVTLKPEDALKELG